MSLPWRSARPPAWHSEVSPRAGYENQFVATTMNTPITPVVAIAIIRLITIGLSAAVWGVLTPCTGFDQRASYRQTVRTVEPWRPDLLPAQPRQERRESLPSTS